MKHNPMATANAAALTTTVVYVVCRLLVGLFPGAMMAVAKSWFHGFDITRIRAWNLTFESFVLGIVSATVFAWLVGYLYGASFEYFSRKT